MENNNNYGNTPVNNQGNNTGNGQSMPTFDANGNITLSIEQLRQLLGQNPMPQQQPVQQPSQQAAPPTSGTNPGTRVIYQSDDFEGEEKKRSFANYDDDDFISSPQKANEVIRHINGYPDPLPPQSRPSFSVSETEYRDETLPGLRSRTVQSSPAIKAPKKVTSAGAGIKPRYGRVQVEEYEYREEELGEDGLVGARTSNNRQAQNGTPSKKKKKKNSAADKTRKIVLAVAILAIIGSGAYLGYEYMLHKQNEEFESEVSNLIIETQPTQETTKAPKKKKDKNKKDNTSTTQQAVTQHVLTEEEQWAEIKKEYPNVTFPGGMQLKYAKLYATNPNFVGYLEAPGSKLSLPIVQTKEEDATNSYLKKNFYGKATKYGCPFVAKNNSVTTLDMNTVIFGHHMNDRTIFGALDSYKTLAGFKAAPVINFNTLYADYTFKVIAAFITNDNQKDDNGYKFEYSFSTLTESSFSIYLSELAKRSLYDTGVDVLPTDKLLTLSTCSHEFDDARFVVVARLCRTGESPDVDVNRATENKSPIYPQAYYDKKKQNNPYTDKLQWYGEYIQ